MRLALGPEGQSGAALDSGPSGGDWRISAGECQAWPGRKWLAWLQGWE